MINIRIICAHEVEEIARTIGRLLCQQGSRVELCVGRAAAASLPTALNKREAVLLIWSKEAYPQSFMHDWMNATGLDRLVEIAFTRAYPRREGARRFAPLDFSEWDGGRGAPVWRLLEDRLRKVASLTEEEPQPAHTRAAMAMSAVGAVMLTAAVGLRIQNATAPPPAPIVPPEPDAIAATFEPATQLTAFGGPIDSELLEPESTPALVPLAPLGRRYAVTPLALDAPAQLVEPMGFHDPGLFRRIAGVASSGLREIGSLAGIGAEGEEHAAVADAAEATR
jgi:hypothetical protein